MQHPGYKQSKAPIMQYPIATEWQLMSNTHCTWDSSASPPHMVPHSSTMRLTCVKTRHRLPPAHSANASYVSHPVNKVKGAHLHHLQITYINISCFKVESNWQEACAPASYVLQLVNSRDERYYRTAA